jgi:hypothetical protein
MDGPEGLRSALIQDSDHVDDRKGAGRRALERLGKPHIGLHRHDLTGKAERLQMICKIGAAHRHAHPVAAAGERLHHVAADKAGTADHDHDPIGGVHPIPLSCLTQ